MSLAGPAAADPCLPVQGPRLGVEQPGRFPGTEGSRLGASRLSPARARAGCRRLLPVQTFLCSSSSRAAHRCLRPPPRPTSRPGAPRGAAADSAALCAGPTLPELAPSRRLGPMAEASESPEMSPDQPAGQEAVAAVDLDPEPEAPGPPAPALRWLPGDPSPRGRSQSDLSSASSRGRPLRVHISGSGKSGAGRPVVTQGGLATGRWQSPCGYHPWIGVGGGD